MTEYLRYAPDIEEIDEGGAETFAKIADTFKGTGEKASHVNTKC